MFKLICGVLRLDGAQADPAIVSAMLDAMRPPNKACAIDLALDGPMGMAILSISTDPDRLPPRALLYHGPSICLAGDVRLYDSNTPDLDLARLADAVKADPDALADLHGDFGFAHWNREQGLLTLGRDHFGTRGLQYTHAVGRYVAFASLPAGLLRTGLASRALDKAVLASYPVNMQPFPGRTYFRDVRSVRAGHCTSFDTRGRKRERRYWRLPLEPFLPTDLAPEDVAAEVRRLLVQAVRRRLPAEGPVASHMSGGLDSTPIAILAARGLRDDGRSCHAYSFQEGRVVPGIAFQDETPYVVEAAASEPNLKLEWIHSKGYFEDAAAGIDADTLLPLSPDHPEHIVLSSAARAGASVLLSGWGGDQAVTSYGAGWDGDLLKTGQLRRLMQEYRERERRGGKPAAQRILSLAMRMLVPGALFPRYYRWRGYSPWFDRTRFTPREKRGIARYEYRPRYWDSRANRRAELEAWWIPYRLEMFAQLGAKHGVSYAYPMLDLDLLRYVMRLPGIYFCRGGRSRSLVRDALKGIVPESVRCREEKYAPFPMEALHAANRRDQIVNALSSLGKMPIVAEFLDISAMIADVQSGRSAAAISEQMIADAATGQQFTSDDDDYIIPTQLAYFLKAQGEVAINP